MNRRTRLLLGVAGQVRRPEPPPVRYLARMRRELPLPVSKALLGRVAREVELSTRTVPGAGVALPVRVYRPRARGGRPLPMVVNFHGGGFVAGSLSIADWLCSRVAAAAGVVVVSVRYRLAPEHPAPVPFEDSWAATCWLVEHAATVGADPTRVTVMGESAGGNLAALVALASRDRTRADPDWSGLVRQILIYPATDLTLSSASVAELADLAPVLNRASLDWYGRRYLPQGLATSLDGADPRVSPLLAPDHSGLPPALILAGGLDPLRDDAVRYAAALSAAGVPTRTVVYPEALHGFMSMPYLEPAAQQGLAEIVAEVRAAS